MPRKLALAAVAALALLLVSGAGAGSAPKIDLSTQSAIDTLLRSKGIDPATVVKQVGLHNYAGPACPGAGWNCTTSTRVVQLSHEGDDQENEGENEFVCKPTAAQQTGTSAATNTCIIVQGGQNNHAHCEEGASTEPLATMTCDITQTGRRNAVEIEQQITQTGGPTQEGQQTARVDQDATEKNVSQIQQHVQQKTSSGDPQSQNAYQEADVTQRVSGSQNYSHVHQTQDQNESGGSALQKQNVTPNGAFDCGNEKPGAPNQCVNVFQDATPDGGTNVSHLHQQTGEKQTSGAFLPNQTQGNAQGGQEGNVHQENPPGVGQNLSFPNQDLRQRQSSPGGVAQQVQVTDPGCCGVGTQIGGAKTIEDIDQATTQSADEQSASQTSSLFGQTHQLSGGESFAATAASTMTPQNHCDIDQHGRNNGGGSTFSAEGDSQAGCADLVLATQCQYPSEGQSCFPAEICFECSLTASLPGTAGADIAMPDYNFVPATYFPPSP
jgi:hypothetical protein